MTIHPDHPFLPPEGDRDPVRRLRARMPSPVSLWATDAGGDRTGLTVSSMLLADGEPPRALALVDEDSDLWDALEQTRTAAVSLLSWRHRAIADAFAGVAPAPGGPFRLSSWEPTDWGPVVADAIAWAGVRLEPGEPRHAGWALLVDAIIEHVEIVDADDEPMTHVRGRYRQL